MLFQWLVKKKKKRKLTYAQINENSVEDERKLTFAALAGAQLESGLVCA